MGNLTIYLVVYGALALGHIAMQMVLGHIEHVRQRRASYPLSTPSVTIVVPAYNEDPALLHRCLLSIDRQDYPEIDVVVVDDGSVNVASVLPVHDEFSSGRFRIVLRPDNTGKRNCQAVVFDQAESDIVVTIDSDTVLEPDAIRTIVRRFADPRVGAVTGNVEVINTPVNLLTRLITYRYWSAFNQERAAQSLFGVVMCASGPFSAYRRSIIDTVKTAYVNQRFLGELCTFGDDRHLTNLVLAAGHRVVYDEAAVARTQVPENLRGYMRQQTRWNKSFYREMLWTARFVLRRNLYMGLDLLLQLVMPFALIGALGVTAYMAVQDPSTAWRYLAVIAIVGFLRSLYGLLRTRKPGFLLFVCYGFVHVFLLIPVRFYALATMGERGWGTRGGTDDEARERGRRNLVQALSPDGLADAETAWSRGIRDAVDAGEDFVLYTQPVERLAGAGPAHAEALLRLRHRDEIVPPARFLALAERAGLSARVDGWVAAAAIDAIADGAPRRLEVNVSAATLRDPGFLELIARKLRERRVSPRNLVLALNERDVYAHPVEARAFGRRVRALGCLVAVDDFGRSGGGSAAPADYLLRELAPDFVKFERSLVALLPDSRETQRRLAALVDLARAQGVEMIATFVGDEETVEILVDLGVGLGQGFHLGLPVPADAPPVLQTA